MRICDVLGIEDGDTVDELAEVINLFDQGAVQFATDESDEPFIWDLED